MSLRFQGIVHLNGEQAQVDAKAKKYQKGSYVSAQIPAKNGTKAIVLTDKDTFSFWKDQGVDAEQKVKFQWLHPIRSFKAMVAEMQEIMGKTQPFYGDVYDMFSRLETYAKKHPETDVSGKPVIRISC